VGAAAEEPNRWLLAGRGAPFWPASDRMGYDLGLVTVRGIVIAKGSYIHNWNWTEGMSVSLWRHIEIVMQDALVSCDELPDSAIRIRMLLHGRGPMLVSEIIETLKMSPNTVRSSCRKLISKGWAAKMKLPDGRRRLIIPMLPRSVEASAAERVTVDRSSVAKVGEWIMLCFLDLKIESAEYIDGARPDWLRNQETGKRMEFDRLYTELRVVFEFQGEQHYGTTDLFPDQEQFERLQKRDNLKAWLCARRQYTYVEVRAGDLTSAGMNLKIPPHVPLRLSWPDSPLIAKLEEFGAGYKSYIDSVTRSRDAE
jgi:DNA-binding MarR family transcriptional regulator